MTDDDNSGSTAGEPEREENKSSASWWDLFYLGDALELIGSLIMLVLRAVAWTVGAILTSCS